MDQWDLWDMSASSFGDGGHAKSSMGPKRWLEVVLFGGKSPCRMGIQWPLLAYIATQVTVISGCSSLLGSVGPRAYTNYLSQAVGAIVHARWVRNGLWRGSFLAKNPCLREIQWRIVCLQCHPSGCDFRLKWFIWLPVTQGTC